jgi:hypothetical protein
MALRRIMKLAGGLVLAALAAGITLVAVSRIAPLLPARGGATCVAATYAQPRPLVIGPGTSRRRLAAVSGLAVRIHFPAGETPYDGPNFYDWRYVLQLSVDLADGRHLSTSATCEWVDGWVSQALPALDCYIDCEGGSVSVWRQPGRDGLAVTFAPHERLRMMHGCGEGGAFIGAEAEWVTLPAARADDDACRELAE